MYQVLKGVYPVYKLGGVGEGGIVGAEGGGVAGFSGVLVCGVGGVTAGVTGGDTFLVTVFLGFLVVFLELKKSETNSKTDSSVCFLI